MYSTFSFLACFSSVHCIHADQLTLWEVASVGLKLALILLDTKFKRNNLVQMSMKYQNWEFVQRCCEQLKICGNYRLMHVKSNHTFKCLYEYLNKKLIYTVLHMFRQVLFGAGNQGNHQNFENSVLTNKF